MKQITLTFLFVMAIGIVKAQDTTGNAGNKLTGMAAEGKIYVVLAVVFLIVAGLLLYLLRLDRKISKLERQNP